jgi:hypothetical protein
MEQDEHGKNLSQTQQQTGWKTLEDIVAGVKKPWAQHGKPDIKIWLDEWGTNVSGLDYAYNPHIGEFGCAKWMTRFYIYSGWLDLPTAWWAFYTDNKSQDWGIIDPKDFSLRPMAYAAQNVCSLVSDVHPVRDLDIQYSGNAPQPKTIAFQADQDKHLMVLAWSADGVNEEVKSYPSKLSFPVAQQPKTVTITDVYWGMSQPAVWTYENGRVIVDQLIVRDYPVMVSCQ